VVTGLVAGAHAGQESGWQPVYRPLAGGPPPSAPTSEFDQDVDLVLAFLNTLDTEAGTDLLGTDADWLIWAQRPGLGEPGDRSHAQQVRDALRGCIIDRAHPLGLGAFAAGSAMYSTVHVALAEGVPVLVGGDAVGSVLAAGARLAVLGQWDRLKICAAGECRWAFYDRSRNRSRTWCSMRVCGNRTKARNWRQRTRAGTPTIAPAPTPATVGAGPSRR
jgi:hypothetical protein